MATTEAQKRASKKYHATHTKRIDCRLPIEIAEEFERILATSGRTKNSVIREFIENYIAENSRELN